LDLQSILASALRSAVGPQAAVYALAAIGLNVHYGYTGLLNFGQVGYMLIGAYGLGVTVATFGGSMWLGILVGLLASVVLSLLLGLPTLRLRADYFAITTIAVAEVLRLVVRSSPATDLTGGPFGLQSIANTFYELNPFSRGRYGVWEVTFPETTVWVLVVTWTLVALSTLVVLLLMRSPWGRVLRSIREDEDAARSLGKNVFSYKMQSLILGGGFGALAGIMFAIAGSTVNADTYLPQVTFFAYAVLILGGAASRFGPIVGSLFFWFLFASVDGIMRQAANQDALPGFLSGANAVGATSLVLVGLGLMLLLIFRPQGMFGNRRELQLDV
jgi:neutral amino acid transport system permease protein